WDFVVVVIGCGFGGNGGEIPILVLLFLFLILLLMCGGRWWFEEIEGGVVDGLRKMIVY
ncbi:hypothetical protein A2U01_0013267, partial [Trifolium medium]|nr:hypothetical protein [Trifolium medium]